MRAVAAVVVAGVWIGAAVPADAQIYSWRDENGVLVLSDRPRPGDPATVVTPSFAVPRTESVRTTIPVAARRGATFEDAIVQHATLNNVRTDLVRAVIQVESAFNPHAQSPKGALGLMQLMPATARRFDVANPFDPWDNIRAGVRYLRELLDRYGNNEVLALAAYNAGPGAVDRYGESVPPYAETRNYVSKISELVGASRAARRPGIQRRTDQLPDGRQVPLYTNIPPAR